MARQKQPAPPPGRGLAWWIVGALGVFVGAGIAFWPAADGQTSEQAESAAGAVPISSSVTPPSPVAEVPKLPAEGPLPPLPLSDFPAARPPEVIRAVYEFAARHPEVLRYVPCYCGCERQGHVGNDDCFIASRDARGNVTWDPHGISCAICIDVARDAMQMKGSGAGPADIRRAIEHKYDPRFRSRTPTPLPPTGTP